MKNLLWRAIVWLVVRNQNMLCGLAYERPYTHIMSPDGSECYMGRWWLFNPYGKDADGAPTPARWPWLPSVRLHHIQRADDDRHLHDHPWNARTIVLTGWYIEERLDRAKRFHLRGQGYTGRLLFGQYHRINEVSPGGVITLFFTWEYQGTWGFLVDGKKVAWKEYLAKETSTP